MITLTIFQSVFIIDLPRLTGMSSQRPELTPFAKDLLYFLEAMGIDQDVKDGVVSFNFAETKNLAFVHTIGGSHTGDSLKKTGYPQLGRGVKQLGLQSGLKDPLQATFATSSVGSLNEAQLEALHTSLKGKDPVLPSGVSKGKASASLNVQPMYLPSNMRSLKDRFHIVFPSHKTVQESKGGTQVSIRKSKVSSEGTEFPTERRHHLHEFQILGQSKFPKGFHARVHLRETGHPEPQ